ncbi:Pre-rRNA-processing protein PNO1 [Phialemonium atrogriseum]|uniref:Pre-rRNA-processing protein PNO1 n=1 Tax=Phialemonium atrogriseum TaxID=1093897 RepID=A0AAJ0FQM6_9PEZI|nr:Pre-rRNA-processing protein PNO1 [Phialemonium atrogriseum]KAK1771419.1 Pre-rRNA-processing protein PNO1 [Phialemonium atrogriseum]
MPAPTALAKASTDAPPDNVPLPEPDQDEELLLDAPDAVPSDPNAFQPASNEAEDTEMAVDEEGRPRFAPGKDVEPIRRSETRKVPVPPHRMAPLKASWPKIYSPLVQHLKLQVRMNTKSKCVELRTSRSTDSPAALQTGVDFVHAFALGFDVDDAVALLRVDDLYIETFEIKDVKTLGNEHLGRAIGRIAGKDGKTKFAIENASRTRIVLADSKISILGSFKNIHMARESIVSLILGKPPGKVYNSLRTVSARMKERF